MHTSSAPDLKSTKFRVDSLALGMVVMLGMTILGRGIGFLRGLAFCRLMDDADVGRWAMAFGFITLITPVMLLGIPGLLPRYTEHFRVRGHLRLFIRRIGLGTIACASLFVAVMLWQQDWFAWFIFLNQDSVSLMGAMAGAVLGMILYNFVSDLSASLRQVRLVSIMQFSQGVGFTLFSVIWLVSGGDFTGVVWMFASSCLVAAGIGAFPLLKQVRLAEMAVHPEVGGDDRIWLMLRRVAPYAFSLWLMNLLGNLFELSDRYMILHLIPVESGLGDVSRELVGQSAVGQYHSGRIFPMLLLSLGTMIAGVMLPYLSADWEKREFDLVRRRVGDALSGLAIVFTLGGAVTILCSPFLFDVLLQGRYQDGLKILPMALCFCTWSALVTVGETYLWTAEKGKWVAGAMLAGLLSNLFLNAWLLPIFGLQGAVIATMLSHAIVMFCVWAAMIRCGFPFSRQWLVVSLLPLTLVCHPVLAITTTAWVAWTMWHNDDQRERWLDCLPDSIRRRLGSF